MTTKTKLSKALKNKFMGELKDKKGRSDYKSASSVERIEAFLKLGRKDPVEYIDGWETAKNHVTELLAKHA